ncbi:lytic transglycosylase domain-containing protein [Paracoccus sp. p4-l81]|uniref:lytic transglycosylase domain-containing protein n=1 Tax=unclassified Paracoccus (in: a-proteobacteria) TaxID=2688777 RepID=UPI0035BA8B3B
MFGKMRSGMMMAVTVVAIGAISLPTMADAEGLKLRGSSSKSRATAFSNQTRLLDNRLAAQYNNSSRLRPGGAGQMNLLEQAAPVVAPNYSGRYRGVYLSHAQAAARRHGIPENIFLRLVQQESGWNPRARSHKGATGLAQLMPGTARKLGVDPHDPQQNLEGGARYLRMMYNRFGDWRLALAAYNAGPEAVARHGGIPPYRETRNYVRVILGS